MFTKPLSTLNLSDIETEDEEEEDFRDLREFLPLERKRENDFT